MANHPKHATRALIGFDALAIEGGLLAAEGLAKIAQLEAAGQNEDDYQVPKGLQLRDEIGRSWRIAQACFSDLEAGIASGADPGALAGSFLQRLLRDAFGFSSLTQTTPESIGERIFTARFFAVGRRVPIIAAPAGAGLDTPLAELGNGRRRRSGFGLLQESLNANDQSLWGLASDGLTLRLARA